MRVYTCWCGGGPCGQPAPGPFMVCAECARFGHLAAPSMGLNADDLWPENLDGPHPIDGCHPAAEGQ